MSDKINAQFERTKLLLGEEKMAALSKSRVAVFGVGGVGGYVCEALARSGIGEFDLIDNDVVSESNINRQIIATYDTIGMYKVDVMKNRILSINKSAKVNVHKCFFLPENSSDFDFTQYSYVVDAIDTVTAKLEIITKAKESNVNIISSMGAGNKLDPTKFVATDIYKTSMCPLAKIMRRELKKRGVKDLKVVYSTECRKKPICSIDSNPEENTGVRKRDTPGSIAFVPSVAGLIVASQVVMDLTK